jgi:dephospho-CoA kinase
MGQRIIGLTGGIAAGKSTVARYLTSNYGLVVLDADVYSHQAVEPGTEILGRIVGRYGKGILEPSGELNRRKLGQIIFNNVSEKRWLEQQIHPFVQQKFAQAMANYKRNLIIVHMVPLLFEVNWIDRVTEIWVVACPEECQLERLKARNGLSEAAAKLRIQGQWSIDKKIELADVVLYNDTTLSNLYRQVDTALGATDQQAIAPIVP